jgi:putative transposase
MRFWRRRTRRSSQPKLRREEPHAWQRRFYDFNLWSERKRIENLRYMHRIPVKRGVVLEPEQCQWSSYRTYAYHAQGRVKINQWTKAVMKVRAVA